GADAWGGEPPDTGTRGAPGVLPRRPAQPPQVQHVATAGAARIPQAPPAAYAAPLAVQHSAAPADASAAPSNPELRVTPMPRPRRSEEHTSELQSLTNLVCRLLLEKKKAPTVHSHWLLTRRPLLNSSVL